MFMATNILAAMNDVAKLAKLTADANVENAQRELDLTAKKELIAIAGALNAAATKGVNELVYNLSTSITRLTNLNLAYALDLIEADMTAAGYAFEKILNNKTGATSGYTIIWEYVEPTEENTDPDPVTPDPDPVTPDPEPVTPDPSEPEENTLPEGAESDGEGGYYLVVDGVRRHYNAAGEDITEPEETPDPVVPDPNEHEETQPTYDEVTAEDVAALEEGQGPVDMNWYELNGETYELSQDETVVAGKTYYKLRTLDE